jgi:predicted membrane protein
MENYIKILIAIFICVMIVLAAKYYFENKRKSREKVVESSSPEELVEKLTSVNTEKPKFIKSEWVGSKPGYVFNRSDENGLGYHLDKYTKNEKGEWVLLEETK